MKTKFTLPAAIICVLLHMLGVQNALAQTAPVSFTYATPQSFTKGSPVNPLVPTVTTNITNHGSGLNGPYDVAVGEAGNIYVADFGNNAVKKISPAGVTTTVVSGLDGPTGVAYDASGNLYVVDHNNNAVVRIAKNGSKTTFYNLSDPIGVAVDAAGNMYVAERGAGRVSKITATGVKTTFGSGISQPWYLAVDKAGNVYVTDASKNKIKKISAGGSTTTDFAVFNYGPTAITVDASGNVYTRVPVVGIQKISPNGSKSTVTAIVNVNFGMSIDSSGNIFASDYYNNNIKKILTRTGADIYSISPSLPAGLTFDALTGIISGTPTIASAQATYTVTGTNSTGSSSTTLQITVGEAPAISYVGSPYQFTVGTAIPATAPFVSGTGPIVYSISPALPAGLAFNTASGAITGTPTAAGAQASYTVTATSPYGSTTFVLSIQVILPPPPGNFSYTTPQDFTKGSAISPLAPIPSGPSAITSLGAGLNGPYDVAVGEAGNVYVADYKGNAVKKISPAGVTTTAVSGLNGPTGVAYDASGNLYVVNHNNNAVVRVAKDGTKTTFSGLSDPIGVAVDAAGNMYVAERGAGRVSKITATGVKTSFGSGIGQPWYLAVDKAGYVYVTDQYPYRVRRISPDGSTTTDFAVFNYPPTAITIDAAGNVYVYVASEGVQKILPNNSKSTVTNAFRVAFGMSIDPSGNIFASDYYNNNIKKILTRTGANTYSISPSLPTGLTLDVLTGIISGIPTIASAQATYTIIGTNSAGSSSTTLQITVGEAPAISYAGSPYTFEQGRAIADVTPVVTGTKPLTYTVSPALPAGLSIDADGVIKGTPTAVSNNTDYTVSCTNAYGSASTVLAIQVTLPPPPGNFSYATPQSFKKDSAVSPLAPIPGPPAITSLGSGLNGPYDVAVGEAGNVYVADYNGNAVKKISPAGVTTTAVSGLSGPTGVAYDASGNLYVVNHNNNAVVRVAKDGTKTTFSGLSDPIGVAVDAAGNMYVAERGAGRVSKITAAGVKTSFGSGIGQPWYLAVDKAGYVYVTDPYGNKVKKISPDGSTTTDFAVFTDLPTAITIDTAGNVYVHTSEEGIQKILPNGSKSTVTAAVDVAYGMSIDPSGNIFASDYYNNNIKKITMGRRADMYSISPTLPTGLTLDTLTGIISGIPKIASAQATYTVTATNIGGSTSTTLQITVEAPITNNAISGSQTACATSIKLTDIGGQTPVGGVGTFAYSWLQSTDSIHYSPMDNQSGVSITYSPAVTISQSTWYKRVVTSGGKTDTSASVGMYVLPYIKPAVTVKADTTSLCAGTKVTLTATAIGGTAFVYQWLKNKIPVGTNSPVYTDISVKNNDVIKCQVTSLYACAQPASVISANIAFGVKPLIVPVVAVQTSLSNPICSGDRVLFETRVVDGGSAPVYEWHKNLSVVGNTSSYIDRTLTSTDSVWCLVTSNARCAVAAPVKSRVVKFRVNPSLAPAITITASADTRICAGTPVKFTAMATDTAAKPKYKWLKNNIAVGTNSAVYTDNTLKNGDSIQCMLSVAAPCVTDSTVTSNKLRFRVDSVVTPSVSIAYIATTPICSGAKVQVRATAINAGTTPVYQWYKNGIAVGGNTILYTDSLPKDKDSIWCVVAGNAVCATSNTAKSNVIINTVNPQLTAGLTVITSPGTSICEGMGVTFTAITTNAGASPHYEWTKNNLVVGTDNNMYVGNNLQDKDSVACRLTIMAPCITPVSLISKIRMTVDRVPPAPVISGPASVTINQKNVVYTVPAVTGATTYNWTVPANAAIISGQGTRSIKINFSVVTGSGDITVTATVNCGVTAPGRLTVTSSAGFAAGGAVTAKVVTPGSGRGTAQVYPNPASGIVKINFTASRLSPYEIQVLNAEGKILQSLKGATVVGTNNITLNISRLAQGAYFVRLIDNEHGTQTMKIIKQNNAAY